MPPKVLSAERVQDSSDEESDTSNPTQTLKETVKTIRRNSSNARAASISSDHESSESDAESQATSSASSIASVSSAGKRKAEQVVSTSSESTAKRVKTKHTPVKRIESTTYVPPQGYVLSKFAAHEFSAKTKSLLENLHGKQIWHISAPSSMPMSKLESLDLEAALNGTPILSNGEVQYTIQINTLEGQNLLAPKGTVGEFAASPCLPSRSFQVREIARKPSKNDADEDVEETSSIQFFATKPGQLKAPRRQPDVLRGRYLPFGIGDASIPNGSDTAMQVDEPERQLQTTPTTPEVHRKSKQKSKALNDELSTPASKKKARKEQSSTTVAESPAKVSSHKKKKDKSMSSSQ